MKVFVFFCTILLEICSIQSRPFYLITSPSIFRLDVPEIVSLSVTNIYHAVDINLSIRDAPKRQRTLYERTVRVSPDQVENTTFVLHPSDFVDTDGESIQSVYLVAKATSNQMRFRKEAEILVSRQSGYIFIQTDKPVYTSGQEVKLRVIPLNELRRPSNASLYIDIKNPQGVIVQRKNVTYQGNFITDTFKLPTRPLYGDNWTVEAKYTNGVSTEKVVTFEVKEYVLPKFSIGVEKDVEIVLPTTTTIGVNITAKYFHGEPVGGTCTLSYGIIADGEKKVSDVDLKLKLISGVADFLIETYKLRDKFPDYWFPNGARLFLKASVLDDGTGRREQVTNKAAVFAGQPYRISTVKSQKFFKPGLTYDIKIETFYANGRIAPNCELKVSCFLDGVGQGRPRTVITDQEGQLTIPIPIERRSTRKLTCKVQTDSSRNSYEVSQQTEVTLEVEAMMGRGNRFIQVKPRLEENTLTADVTSSRPGTEEYVHLIISGGRILSAQHTRGGNSFTLPISGDMAPDMRILTYTFHTRGHGRRSHTNVLADSSIFNVDSICNHGELILTAPNTDVTPKSVMTFNITGAPRSKVGFLAVDKAVYQISDKNRMRKEKMISEFAGHDTSCSVGGGVNVNKVFEDAGLTVITNADVVTSQRQSIECPTRGRKKRSINPREDTNPCCAAGRNFSYTFGQNHLLGNSECYSEGQQIFQLTNSSNCAKSFYRCCMQFVERLSSPSMLEGLRGPSSIYDFDRSVVMSQEEEYTFRDIDAEMDDIPIRSYFPESWLFQENSLDGNGTLSMTVELPDSTTTHVLQAVSLSPVYGMCVADPVDVISTKDFFIDLDLPYSVVRMEQTEIRVTLYNYGNQKLPCHIRLLETEGVCSAEQDKVSIEIEPNDVQLARFPIVPMSAGDFILDVVVLCEVSSVGDRIRKTLKVVNEGREEKKTVSFWLDPKGRRRHHYDETDVNIQVTHPFTSINTQVTTVDLTLPKEAIPGTGKCKVSAIGNIMDAAVQTVLGGVHDLLDNVPHGCGEQTMILMAPLVYAMRYLQGTGRLTPQAEMRGKFFMKVGYQRELSFRKPDGSFSVWQHRASSTWLTAFVMKVFCQAKQYIDIDQNVICSGMEWLFTKQNQNGSFTESSPVYHKEIMGGINGETSMTAFVLISMLECDCRMQGTSERIARAVNFLENQFLRAHHPYSISISAYALVLANNHRKWRINRKLHRYSQLKRFSREQGPEKGYRYWPVETSDFANQTEIPFWYRKRPSAISIETTAYALLTQLELDKLRYSHNIVEWMVEQQQASGAFISTQDTIVGLQALSMYNIRTYAEDVNMRCIVTRGDNSSTHMHLREHEAMVEKSVHDIPATGQLQITTQGSGVARMEVEVSFNVNDTKQDQCKFDINVATDDIEVDILKEKQANGGMVCDVCGDCTEIDFDILIDKYNVPDPNPRIGFSNANVYSPDMIQRPPSHTNPVVTDVLDIDLTGSLDAGPQGRSDERRPLRRLDGRRPTRRPGRRSRSVRRRGASRRQKCLEICVSYLGNEILDMPVVDVGLPTGYYVEDEDLKKTVAADFIDSYDVSRRGVTFYMEKIPQSEVCFKLRMVMDFEVENLQSAKIEVYDYSKKDERCVKFYSLQYDVAELDVFCSKEKCHCVEGECAENYDSKMKSNLVAATDIFEMACYEYDYVLRIEATGIRWTGNHLVVSTIIHSVINKDADLDDLVVDGEIEFWMNLRCSADMLETGHYYIIYGNGGYKYIDESGTKRYRYYLHRDSIVMKDWTRSMYNPENDSQLNYWQRLFLRMESRLSRFC